MCETTYTFTLFCLLSILDEIFCRFVGHKSLHRIFTMKMIWLQWMYVQQMKWGHLLNCMGASSKYSYRKILSNSIPFQKYSEYAQQIEASYFNEITFRCLRYTRWFYFCYTRLFKLLVLYRVILLVLYQVVWFDISMPRVLFENRPPLYFCNYIFIPAHKLNNFGFRIKDTV